MPRGGSNYRAHQIEAFKPKVRAAREQGEQPPRTFTIYHENPPRQEQVRVFVKTKTKAADYYVEEDNDRLYNGRVTDRSSCEFDEPKYCLTEEYEADHELVKAYSLKHFSLQPVLVQNLFDEATKGDGKNKKEQFEKIMSTMLTARFDLAPAGFLANLNYVAFAKLAKAYVDVCATGKDRQALTSVEQEELIDTIIRHKLDATNESLGEMKDLLKDISKEHEEFKQHVEAQLNQLEQGLAGLDERVTGLEGRMETVQGDVASLRLGHDEIRHTQDEHARFMTNLQDQINQILAGTAQPRLTVADAGQGHDDVDSLTGGFNVLAMAEDHDLHAVLDRYQFDVLCGEAYANIIVKPNFISGASLQTLQDGEWLNDAVIDEFFSLLSVLSDELEDSDDCKFFSIFFYSTLTGGKPNSTKLFGYDKVKKWTRGRKGEVSGVNCCFSLLLAFSPQLSHLHHSRPGERHGLCATQCLWHSLDSGGHASSKAEHPDL